MFARDKKIPVKVNVRLAVIVTTDEDSGSEADDYGDTEEERNEVEDVIPFNERISSFLSFSTTAIKL